MSLGTRLHFLVAQTDVSGLWALDRRIRIIAYAAGSVVDLSIAAVALLASATVATEGTVHQLLRTTAVLVMTSITYQLMIFMRTDCYFALQDFTRCRNLYADGTAYLRYLSHVVKARYTATTDRSSRRALPTDPSLALAAHERRAVRIYSALVLIGTTVYLLYEVTFMIPFDFSLLGHALSALFGGNEPESFNEALFVLIVAGTGHFLWFRSWWRRHGHRVRTRLANA